MNTFTATGRLANDAHLSNASGTSVSNFRLISEAGYGKHQKTLWIDCSLWGPKADALQQYLTKSKHVLITGELTTKEYTRKDGSLGHGFSLTVDRIEFIGKKNVDDQEYQRSSHRNRNQQYRERDYYQKDTYNTGKSYRKNDYGRFDKEIPDEDIADDVSELDKEHDWKR